jgi:hypothetical protein
VSDRLLLASKVPALVENGLERLGALLLAGARAAIAVSLATPVLGPLARPIVRQSIRGALALSDNLAGVVERGRDALAKLYAEALNEHVTVRGEPGVPAKLDCSAERKPSTPPRRPRRRRTSRQASRS